MKDDVNVVVRIEESIYQMLVDYCKKNNLLIRDVVVDAIHEYCKTNKKS